VRTRRDGGHKGTEDTKGGRRCFLAGTSLGAMMMTMTSLSLSSSSREDNAEGRTPMTMLMRERFQAGGGGWTAEKPCLK
jgi:hypothetical protein